MIFFVNANAHSPLALVLAHIKILTKYLSFTRLKSNPNDVD